MNVLEIPDTVVIGRLSQYGHVLSNVIRLEMPSSMEWKRHACAFFVASHVPFISLVSSLFCTMTPSRRPVVVVVILIISHRIVVLVDATIVMGLVIIMRITLRIRYVELASLNITILKCVLSSYIVPILNHLPLVLPRLCMLLLLVPLLLGSPTLQSKNRKGPRRRRKSMLSTTRRKWRILWRECCKRSFVWAKARHDLRHADRRDDDCDQRRDDDRDQRHDDDRSRRHDDWDWKRNDDRDRRLHNSFVVAVNEPVMRIVIVIGRIPVIAAVIMGVIVINTMIGITINIISMITVITHLKVGMSDWLY